MSVAQWQDGERLITMQGNVGPKQLEAIAETVHQSSKRSVRKQLDASKAPEVAALRVPPKTIASGTLGDGWPWTIQVSTRNPSNASDGYLWWIGQPGDSAQPTETRISLPTGKPTIETIVEHGRTYVLAKVPLSMTGAQLHLNPNGLPSTVAPLMPIDPSLADNFTATVFSSLFRSRPGSSTAAARRLRRGQYCDLDSGDRARGPSPSAASRPGDRRGRRRDAAASRSRC